MEFGPKIQAISSLDRTMNWGQLFREDLLQRACHNSFPVGELSNGMRGRHSLESARPQFQRCLQIQIVCCVQGAITTLSFRLIRYLAHLPSPPWRGSVRQVWAF